MQQSHGTCLVVAGAGVHQWAYQHLRQSAADGVQYDGGQQSGEGRHDEWQDPQPGNSGCREYVRRNKAGAVSYLIHESGGGKVDDQLHQEVYRDQQRDLLYRDTEAVLEYQKQQRRKVVDYRLGYVPSVACKHGVLKVVLY